MKGKCFYLQYMSNMWYKIAQNNNIVYRGTPQPESAPRPRDFPGIWTANDAQGAKNWGKFISSYQVINPQKFINSNNANLDKIVKKFLMESDHQPEALWQNSK